MNRLLLRLYSVSWRERYGAEFEALLEERPLGPFDVADVVLGALDAHLHFRRPIGAADAGKGISGSDDDGLGQWLGLAGTLGLLVALTGLSAIQSRLHPRLVWAAFALPALGALASGSGLLGMVLADGGPVAGDVDPWLLWALGTVALIAGSGLFALVSWRSRVLFGPGLALLAVPVVGLIPVVVASSGLLPIPWEPLVSIAFLALLLSFGIGWIVLGLDTVRRDRRLASAIGTTP
jgi:hypothetical protein